MKLLILSQYPLNPAKIQGGVETVICALMGEFRGYKDLDTHVLTLSDLINKDKEVIKEGIIVHYISSPSLPRLLTGLTVDLYRVLKKIKELKPDIVHAHMTGTYALAALMTGYPSVLTVHGVIKQESKTWKGIIGYIKGVLYRNVERYILRRTKNIIAISDYVKKEIQPVTTGNIYSVPNPLDKRFFDIRSNEKKNRLLFIGGIEPRKGLINLLKAIKIVKKRELRVELHIIGRARKQKYFDDLKKYVKENNLIENVKFLGFLSEEKVEKEYSESSIFILPSKEDSQPLVLLEAMAAGKAIVATNSAGIPYVVDDSRTGYLVEYGDIKELAEKILKLLVNENLRKEMGKQGKEKARHYLSQNISRKTYEIYKKVISEYQNENRNTDR